MCREHVPHGPTAGGDPREAAPDSELNAWLLRWRRHAEVTASAGGEVPAIDVGPQNVIVGDERLETIDDEWAHADYSVEDAIDRSLLHVTFALAEEARRTGGLTGAARSATCWASCGFGPGWPPQRGAR